MKLGDSSSEGSSSSDEDINLLFLENECFPRTLIVEPLFEFGRPVSRCLGNSLF